MAEEDWAKMAEPVALPNNLDAYWMPFTPNRRFKAAPRFLVAASGMYYRASDGRSILDGTSGLWCCAAGHSRRPIVEAIQRQAATLDYAPPFQWGHPKAFEAAERLVDIMPSGLDKVFFTNSGSEAVDTALKIALAYHQARGQGGRTRFIGRERGYHGVGFGGISVGGIANNRRLFPNLLQGTDYLPHTHDLARNAFSKGEPEHGKELALELERLVTLHDASTIAAVIVEPVAGSAGVLIPPKFYLPELRRICDKYGILLIFDEVITGFGRLGAAFGADRFGVTPDIMTVAKGLTSGTVPMGATVVRGEIQRAIFEAAAQNAVELPHGYTYSAHPLATAAAVATLDLYRQEGLFERATELAPHFERAAHALKGLPHVIDIRNLGLVAAIELESLPGQPGERAYQNFLDCFERGLLIRTTADVIAISPPLIAEPGEIDRIFETIADSLRRLA